MTMVKIHCIYLFLTSSQAQIYCYVMPLKNLQTWRLVKRAHRLAEFSM